MSKLSRHLESPIIECACGCGQQFHSISIHGDKLKYIKGHQNKMAVGHNFKGGQVKTVDGRMKILSKNHPYKDHLGYVFKHRLIMEKHLGRYLRPDEYIHHINEVKDDDRIENLQIVTSSEHTIIHNRKDMSNRICIDCKKNNTYVGKNGTPYWWKAGLNEWRCHLCAMRNKYKTGEYKHSKRKNKYSSIITTVGNNNVCKY